MKHHRYKWPMAPLATSVARRSLSPKPKCLHLQQSPENWKHKTDKRQGTQERQARERRQGTRAEDHLKRYTDRRTGGQAWRPPWPGTESCAARFDIGIQYGWSWAQARVRARAKAKAILGQSSAILHNPPAQLVLVLFSSLLCFALHLFFHCQVLCLVCCVCFFYSFFRASRAEKDLQKPSLDQSRSISRQVINPHSRLLYA